MDAVERANGFCGERPAGPGQDSVSDGDDVALPPELLQPSKSCPLIGGRNTSRDAGAYYGARGFCKCQSRRYASAPLDPQRLSRRVIFFQQSREQGAGLDIRKRSVYLLFRRCVLDGAPG